MRLLKEKAEGAELLGDHLVQTPMQLSVIPDPSAVFTERKKV